ncbi:hypothetical protein L6452_09313 [Arctium lappa]|uniref:Uncharacterized protein n=1 Tax=Arctium lappa TaxID=4217 RepID=A0ACB9DK97_ARCLA|nr:hypothetical protein L6452_09313 [Arctium lappa]
MVNKSSAGSTALDPRIESIQGAKILVAKGLAYPLSTDVLHGNPLEEGFMKVQVDMVMDGCEDYDLPVPMPNADIEKLGQAIGNFIQWEIRSVVLRQSTSNKSVTSAPPMSEPILPHIQKEDVAHSNKVQKYDEAHSKRVVTASEPRKNKKIVKKTKALPKLMQDRPPAMKELFQCLHSSKEWPTTGVTVLVEAGVLGHTSMHIGVEYDDLKLLMTNGWLDQNIIAWYLTDLHKIVSQNSRNKCAFIAPGVINTLEIEWDDTLVIDTILSTMMHQKEKEFFLAPYSQGHHWSLLIIRPRRSLVYVLDSMMTNGKTAETYMIKGLIDMATAKYNHATGSSQANTSVTWRLNKCNQQQDGWECGYYVVKQIFQFVMHEQYSSSLKDTWTTTDPFTSTQVEEIACNIARSFTLKRMKESKMW